MTKATVRRKRRQQRARLRFGYRAAPRHKSRHGRTGAFRRKRFGGMLKELKKRNGEKVECPISMI